MERMEPRIVGGHVALDLVNTVAPRVPGGVEFIGSPSELAAWARRIDLGAAGGTAPADAAALGAAIEVGEATYEVLTAALGGGRAAPGALVTLTRHWAAAAGGATLAPAGPGGPPAVL